MSLLVWLPLISNTKNQGLSNPTITTTGTITYSAGKIGNALTFNNSALTLKPAPITTAVKEFSFAFWYKPTSTNSYQCLYNGRTSVGGAIAIFRDPSNLWRFDDGSQRTFNFGTVANEWHHYVFTRDESNVKLYIDGVLKQTMTSASFTCDTVSASIGMSSVSNATPNANPIIGQVNDYRIYNHVLSVREIKELAKGLMTHLPLSWGANPNMVKNSYTHMNKNTGSNNGGSSTVTISKAIVEDNSAPCKWVFKLTATNSGTSNTGQYVGSFFGIAAKGLATTDLTENEYYTYSFWAKSDSGLPNGLAAGSIVESQTHVSNSGFGALDSNWRKHIVTFKFTKTDRLTSCYYVAVPASSTIDFQICGLKLEKGQTATDYIPHVEEAAYTSYGYATKYYQDCSGYNRNVTVSGTLTIGENSPRGTGTNFNKAKITISDGFPVGTQTPFTIAYWHKPITGTYTTWADSVGFDVGNSSSTAASTQMRRETYNNTGTGYAWYGNGVVNNGGGDCSYAPTMDTWYHYAYTFNGTTFTQYINGVQNKTATLGSTYEGFKTYPRFYVGDTGTFYQQCADVRVYATCLSADDIKELYSISAQIDKSGKVYCSNLVEV